MKKKAKKRAAHTLYDARTIVRWADTVGGGTVVWHRVGLAVCFARRLAAGCRTLGTKHAWVQWPYALKLAKEWTRG
jgi:hypothetical protein